MTVVVFTPKTNNENDLFKTALRHNWDFAILLLNNISYASGNRKSRAIAHGSINFVMKMVIVFDKPVFALRSLGECPWYQVRLQEVGAAAVYRVPFDLKEMMEAIRRCKIISAL